TLDIVRSIVGFATGFLACAAAMLINDVVDLPVDRINKPWKPLPSGKIDINTVKIFSIVFLSFSILINIYVSTYAIMTVAVFALIGFTYNFLRRFWWSHFLVSISTFGPIIYGYILSGTPTIKLWLAVSFSIVIFFINSAREFVKSIADVEGDRRLGYSTVATRFGVNKAAYTSLLFSIIGVAIAILPGISGLTGMVYTIILTISGLLFTLEAYRVTKNPIREVCEKAKNRMIKYMFVALIGFLLSGL
ncbi:geranylgeranylglyceryl phosphate synthase, partial [Candidatus Geothermarchaeota archaeon]